jgi:hypothetical protein
VFNFQRSGENQNKRSTKQNKNVGGGTASGSAGKIFRTCTELDFLDFLDWIGHPIRHFSAQTRKRFLD